MSLWEGLAVVLIILFFFVVIPNNNPAQELCFETFGDKNELNNYCKIWGYCSCEYVTEDGLLVKHRIDFVDGKAYFNEKGD